jgi:hypothetical protein
MSSPVKLVGPYPTMDEVAEVYGISAARLKRLKSLVRSLAPGGRDNAARGRSTGLAKTVARKATRGATARSRPTKSSHNGHKKRATDKK